MSATIEKLQKTVNGIKQDVYPVTTTSAVVDATGNNLDALLSGKQGNLVSGENIKTLNGEPLLGTGNIVIQTKTNFRGSWATWNDVPNDSSLYPVDPKANHIPLESDYIYISDASEFPTQDPLEGQWKFIYTGKWEDDGKNGWIPSYMITDDCNIRIGTRTDRTAYHAYEGLQWNEISDTGILSERYVFKEGSWIKLGEWSPVETVNLKVTTYDGASTEGLNISVFDNNIGTILYLQLDVLGECSFEIPKGHTYTISITPMTGYRGISDITYSAALESRPITLEFQPITIGTEEIQLHVRVYDSTGTDITEQDVDFIGLEVNCSIPGKETVVGYLDSSHNCIFRVQFGDTYTISLPMVPGFTTVGAEQSHLASITQRNLTCIYKEFVNIGIYGVDDNGSLFTYSDMQTMTDAQKQSIHYIALNTSRLREAGASFLYSIPVLTQKKTWASSNVEFDQSLLPFKTSQATAVLDLDGQRNTDYIKIIGDSLLVETPAADWCSEQTVTIGGITKEGFLGSYGQMYALSENKVELNAMHAILGVDAPTFTSGAWWTSAQYSATLAVYLYNGGFNYSYKYGSTSVVPLFAF